MRVKLGDICEIVSGSTPKTNIEEYWDGDIKWITPAELNDETYIITDSVRKITELGVKKTGLTPFPKGTVILSSRAPIGKVAIAGCEMYCNQGFKNLICSEKIDNRYLYWFLKGNTEFLQSLGRGATFKEISKTIVANIEINIPDKSVQTQIVDNLEKTSQIIRLRKQELSKLEELVRARFVELFGDENNSKNWSIVHIEDVADVQVGVVIKPSQYYTDESNGIKAFRSLNVGAGFIKDSDWVYFTAEGHQKNSKSILRENDLLIVRSGAPGTACVVTEDYVGCNAIDIIIAHPDCEKVNPYYLCTFTNMPHGKKQIVEGTGGAAQQHFNVGKYNKLQLMLPPKELQDKFVEFINQIAKSKAAVQKALDQTQQLFDSLMQEYFG
ncbi:restriction endonuclease subunit S [Clostridiaceae bacterium Marseille-Q3526]|nr:restriction endonuclease subunit S [Clostridiaceae bacterium Marseille-Q3526]